MFYCFFWCIKDEKKRKEDEGINVIYKNEHSFNSYDREATIMIAAQSIEKEEVIVGNGEIYNKRMGSKGQAIGE